MPPFTPAQVESMIRTTWGVAVVHGSVTTYGHHEKADRPFAEHGVTTNARHQFVRIATGRLSGVAVGDAITVDGTAYTVADVRVWDEDGAFGDGSLTEIELGA